MNDSKAISIQVRDEHVVSIFSAYFSYREINRIGMGVKKPSFVLDSACSLKITNKQNKQK